MRSLRSSRPMATRVVAASATAVLLGAFLAGCGSSSKDKDSSGDKKSDTPSVKVLSVPEATTALLTQTNLGAGVKLDPTADHSSAAPGCLTPVDEITDKTDAPTHAVVDFVADNETQFPSVTSQVNSYASVADAKKAMTDLRETLKSCTSVEEEGFKADIQSADDKSADTIDDQYNLAALGTIENGGQTSPIGLFLAVARVDNNISLITVGALATTPPGDIPTLVKIVNDRLAAVVAGKQPDDTVVAGQ
jgi:hypothetical protein